MESKKNRGVCILGSTGSIGTQALDVLRLFPDRFRVRALTAHRNVDLLAEQAREFQPDCVVIMDPAQRSILTERLQDTGVRILIGDEGMCEAATLPEVETVVASVVGFAGLQPVLAAINAGKRVALANKETLVVAGEIVYDVLRKTGGVLIPVDSEHSAIFQCLVGEPHDSIEKIILTASGGPFRTRPADSFEHITKAEALRHPNWSMGAKITIDSASMMNKGLEVIEARWMFDLRPDQIEVLVHPQSIIHSMVAFTDGSTKAQIGLPDMKVPIQYALTYPERWPAPHGRVDWSRMAQLDFEPPDLVKFPCLRLAYEALELGGTAPAVLNAANEEAVALFLDEQISFIQIAPLIEEALETLASSARSSLETLIDADRQARRFVQELSRATVH